MKTYKTKPPGLFSKLGAVAFSALAILWLPHAEASVSGGATIENVAQVSWEDSGGNPYSAYDYTVVTVTTLDSAVTISGAPAVGFAGTLAAEPAAVTTALDGATVQYIYAVTSTANGTDTYQLIGNTALANATNLDGTESLTIDLLNPDASLDTASITSLTLGSAIVKAVTDANTLEFPGGSLASSGIIAGDIVVINGVDYLVTGITAGNAQDTSGGLPGVSENNDSLDLAINLDGGNIAPAFTVANIGNVVGEQQLVRVNVTGNLSVATSVGDAEFTLTVNKGSGVTETTGALVNTVWNPLPAVTIIKEVRNITNLSAFSATASGDPGDILEYRLTISNSGSTAEAVVVTDPVPTYTTLQIFASGTGYPDPTAGTPSTTLGDGGAYDATDIFAQVRDASAGPVTVNLTAGNGDDEGTNIASGDVPATAAGSTLSIYVGRDQTPSNTGPLVGGDIADSATVTDDVFYIYYRVRINP